MKKLYWGLMALCFVMNVGAMENDRIKRAYKRLDIIIGESTAQGTSWSSVFSVLNSVPNVVNTYIAYTRETLLQRALEEENFVAAKRLLQQFHADPHRIVNFRDLTPLQIAREHSRAAGAQEVIALLESYGDESGAED